VGSSPNVPANQATPTRLPEYLDNGCGRELAKALKVQFCFVYLSLDMPLEVGA